ncbi:hypothetical protein RMCBS344292_07837 [Rhizopus microsporus]|nr:hypothetical protein RMCBS344292_07837 [Rhizopus microsporus]
MKRHSTSSSLERSSKGVNLNESTVASTQEADDSSTVKQEGASSSSKQKALKEVKFPSCGLTTHARSTSNLCPNKKAKVPVCSPDERVENFVIKTSLPNVCNNQQLVQYIKDLADYTTKFLFMALFYANDLLSEWFIDELAVILLGKKLIMNKNRCKYIGGKEMLMQRTS